MRSLAALWRLAAAGLLLGVCRSNAAPAATPGLFDLLRPGSRPSIGIGGDPFLSPLDDEAGWWPRLGVSDSTGTWLEYDETASPGSPRGAGAFEQRALGWRASQRGRVGRSPWNGALTLSQPQWTADWSGSSGGLSIGRRPADPQVEAGGRIEVLPGLWWQGSGLVRPPSGSSRSDVGAGVRYARGPNLKIQGSWRRTRFPESVDSDLAGEPISVSSNLGFESRGMDARLPAPFGLVVEGSLARTRWIPLASPTRSAGYQLVPRGSSGVDQAALGWSLPGDTRILGRWTHLGAEIEGDLRWNGERFGGLDYGKIALESYLVAIETRRAAKRWALDVEHTRATGRGRGEVESWPFTSTLADFLGQRRIFRAGGEARWTRAHLGMERGIGATMRARAGVEWIDLTPRGEIESWRPAFLVFGRADAQEDVLDVRRIQLGVLSLGWSWRFSGTELELGLQQCVYARSIQRSAAEPEKDGSAGSTPEAGGASASLPSTVVHLSFSRAGAR